MSRLFVVSTPIGNLGDITQRALEVLGDVDRVLAEDTRRTSGLLRHYEIAVPMTSLHEHNEAARAEQVLAWLDAGDELALVSDAGTPLLSDPGARTVREVVAAGHTVVPIPGASALLAALVGAAIEPEPFTFYGFLPRKGTARRELLDELAELEHTIVLYEAANRLLRTLRDLEQRCGEERQVAVARELTKLHETFVRGTLADAVAYYEEEPARGEVVVVLAGRERAMGREADTDERTARVLARALLDEGRRPSSVAREVERRAGLSRNRAYALALELAEKGEGESS